MLRGRAITNEAAMNTINLEEVMLAKEYSHCQIVPQETPWFVCVSTSHFFPSQYFVFSQSWESQSWGFKRKIVLYLHIHKGFLQCSGSFSTSDRWNTLFSIPKKDMYTFLTIRMCAFTYLYITNWTK